MDNISIKTKSWVVLALIVATLLITTAISFSILKESIIHERQKMLVDITNMAHTIIQRKYAMFRAGKLTEEQARQAAIDALRQMRIGKNSYIFIYRKGVAVLSPENPANEGKNLIDVQDLNGTYIGREMVRLTQNGKSGFISYYWYKPHSREPVEKLSYIRGFEPWDWFFGTGVYQDDLNDFLLSLLSNKIGLLLLVATMFTATILLVFSINRSSVNRTLRVKDYLETLGTGDFSQPVITEGKDEIGQMTHSLLNLQTQLETVVSRLGTAAGSVQQGIQEISTSNQKLAQRTVEQVRDLDNINSILHKMADLTRSNASAVNGATESARRTRSTVTQGKSVVNMAMEAMENINRSSTKVTEIVSVIDDLAFQTNLLALNAAVEAARAGDQGKGFAVVASEVRNLAQRSSESAQEIRSLIEESSRNVETGTELVNDSGKLLGDILDNFNTVNELLSGISAASEEQTEDIENICNMLEKLNEFSQKNLGMVENAASASRKVNDDAHFMHSLMAFFTLRDQLRTEGQDFPIDNTTSRQPSHATNQRAFPADKREQKAIEHPGNKVEVA
jgi:methyl-accepting chemotaxis protein